MAQGARRGQNADVGAGKVTSEGTVRDADAGSGQGRRLAALAGFVALAFVPTLGAVVARPDAWYQGLAKPSWNPPPWVFGPVWTLLYATLGLAAWRVWRRSGWSRPLAWWGLQLLLNAAWTPVFFGAHRVALALVVVLLLLAAILAFMAAAWRRHRLAAWLFAPYAAWVAFAATLNAAILALNGA